jgi:hypothetical protein
MTFFPFRTRCAQREFLFGFCSSPRIICSPTLSRPRGALTGWLRAQDSSRFRARPSSLAQRAPATHRNQRFLWTRDHRFPSPGELPNRPSILLIIRSAHCTVDEIRFSVRGLGRLSPRSSGVLQMPRHQDPGHNGQHAFAPFIHAVEFTGLILIRHDRARTKRMERVEDAGIDFRFLFAKSLTPGHTKTQGLSKQLSVHGGLIRPIAKRLGGVRVHPLSPGSELENCVSAGSLKPRITY